MLMVDADSPGVTVRPIALASGRRELAEVFFDDVRVDRERLIGDVDGGWAVAMHLMQYERGMYGYAVADKVLTELSRLRDDMASPVRRLPRSASLRPGLRRRCRPRRPAPRPPCGGSPTAARSVADSSIDKLLFGRAEKDVNDLIIDVRREQMIGGVAAATTSSTGVAAATTVQRRSRGA